MIGLALLGCTGDKDATPPGLEPQHAVLLEGFRYGWAGFNHRLSHLEVEPGDDHASIAVIGGTSTTSEVPEPLPAECVPEECQEFPVPDQADVELRWAIVDTGAVALGTGRADLVVGAEGAATPLEVPLAAGGDATGVITGIVLSTDEPLAIGEACYRPRYGWHPRRIQVALGDVTVAGTTASVPISAAFAAGNTLETERTCVDAVNEEARVALTVHVAVAAADGLAVAEAALHTEATYPFSGDAFDPEPQPEPAPQDLGLSVGDGDVLGFSALDFRFHEGDPDDRGAYLRTLAFHAAPDGTANATATNWSPFTQLSGFSFSFDGTVRAISTEGTVTRGTATARFPAQIEEDGTPVVHSLPY